MCTIVLMSEIALEIMALSQEDGKLNLPIYHTGPRYKEMIWGQKSSSLPDAKYPQKIQFWERHLSAPPSHTGTTLQTPKFKPSHGKWKQIDPCLLTNVPTAQNRNIDMLHLPPIAQRSEPGRMFLRQRQICFFPLTRALRLGKDNPSSIQRG